MESDSRSPERETPPQHWTSCRLMIDPALTRGLYKVYRYDGQHFNIPVEDLGLFPVETVRDPRICRLWSNCSKTELLVAKFKVDEWYVGPVPPKEVTFSRLNDNVREAFLTNMCKSYGSVEEVEIFYNPKNKKHLGVAKVIFDTVRAAKDAVQHLHQTSVMGNVIHVEIDPKGENRGRYLQLLLRGLYTPWTLPVGSSNERALQSLIDSLLCAAASQRQAAVAAASSPTFVATPLSLDTAYSSIWQDTPCSFGLTPRSQGTPRTPCLSATPLSQDSCYSSLQATPVLQGEPSSHSVHKPPRRELCQRKPAGYHRGGSGEGSDVVLKPPPPPLHPLPVQTHAGGRQLVLWSHNAQPSAHANTAETSSFNLASPCQESTSGRSCRSLSILSINFTAERQTAASSPPVDRASITVLSPSAAHCPPSSPQPAVESLDSRIESLLINSQNADASSFFDRKPLELDVCSDDSPTSPSDDSLVCSPSSRGSFAASRRRSFSEPADVDPTWLEEDEEDEEDETTRAVSFLTRSSQSPAFTDFTQLETSSREVKSSCPKEHHGANEDEDIRPTGALTPAPEISSHPHPPSFPPPCSQLLTSKAPPAVRPGCPHRPVAPFPFPIPPFPPSVPPVPPRLPNGTIPIPPPGWIPPPGIGIPPPPPGPPPIPPPRSIPPPPAFLGPPPPLMVPPPVPPPVYPVPNPPRHGGRPLPPPFPRPPWPAPPFPRFNPFVPPPDFPPVRENPHKVTIEKVLEVIVDELRSIIKKDITRRMIEGVSFKAFEDWWDCQEKKIKVQVSPLKSGAASVDDRTRRTNILGHIGGPGKKPPLPSFKVKRKRAVDDPATAEETESASARQSADVNRVEENFRPETERTKRRHARPHELDSDDDDDDDDDDDEGEGKKELQDKDVEATVVTVNKDPPILCDRDDETDDGENLSEREKESAQKDPEDEDAVIFTTSDGAASSDGESSSDSSSSEESEYSSDVDSSDSFSSESSEDSSCSGSGPEEEEEEDMEDEECIVISSDEESMELEPPATPSAPLTPGAQLELDLHDWSAPFHGEETEEERYTSCPRDACELDVMMELQTSELQDHLRPLSPIGLPAVELHLDVEMESPDWTLESPENIETLRPPTPTGCPLDSDPDLLMKPASPAVEEVERPQTPGRGIAAELGSEDSADEVLSLSPELAAAPSGGLASLYRHMADSPGREDGGGWTQYSARRAPATPGRETAVTEDSPVMFLSLSSPLPVPCLSGNPYVSAPKTPGRDIILPRRSIVHRRKTQPVLTSCDPPRGSVSSPCSLSPDHADGKDAWFCSGVRTKPLQGLENMPGLLDEDNGWETQKSALRRKQLRRMKRRWRVRHWRRSVETRAGGGGVSSHGRRTLSDERHVLHWVWSDGLDEEDARMLRCTYDRLQEQDDGCGWISDTLWTPHPLTKVPTEKLEEHKSWLPPHRTGSARSEGFYKISKKDKLKYLDHTKQTTEPASTNSQGICIPAQQQTSLRAGSDFRSEQRRLLSSFSCDSDLVKFNQLKFRKKKIRFSRSHIHEWGLFAMEPIAADEMVIEYVGQVIRQGIADTREQRYEEEGIGSSYLFRVDQDTIIDATKCGNLARFINHSCNPNCYAKIITVESQKKIVIYSRQPISIDEEITYDYKFPIEETKIPCLCGADGCRGSLN